MTNSDLMGVSKKKSIETPEIQIKGNIITWENTMLQISNISGISTAQEIPPFPSFSISLIVGGLLLWILLRFIQLFQIIGIIAIIWGITIIVFYAISISDRRYHLSIMMNCGLQYDIVVNDKEFLDDLLNVLEEIIIKGGIGNNNFSINIENSKLGILRAFDESTFNIR